MIEIVAKGIFVWVIGSFGFGLGWWCAAELGAREMDSPKLLFASVAFIVFAILAHDIVA